MTNPGQDQKGIGPEFAREAVVRLATGDSAGALALAREGVEKYPRYAMGFYVLGLSFESAGNLLDASVAIRSARRLVPDAPVLLAALGRIETAQMQSYQETGPEPSGALQPHVAPANEIEQLARELEHAPKTLPPLEAEINRRPAANEQDDSSRLLVSATLAEIYLKQGQIAEAIRMYRVLAEKNVDGAEKYRARLAELEEQLRSQSIE